MGDFTELHFCLVNHWGGGCPLLLFNRTLLKALSMINQVQAGCSQKGEAQNDQLVL